MGELLEILETLRPDVDFGREERLVEDGILDSFDIVSIVAEVVFSMGISDEKLLFSAHAL